MNRLQWQDGEKRSGGYAQVVPATLYGRSSDGQIDVANTVCVYIWDSYWLTSLTRMSYQHVAVKKLRQTGSMTEERLVSVSGIPHLNHY